MIIIIFKKKTKKEKEYSCTDRISLNNIFLVCFSSSFRGERESVCQLSLLAQHESSRFVTVVYRLLFVRKKKFLLARRHKADSCNKAA